MTTNRPAPAVIQRANSLQASDTSHTSASTSTSHTTNTSASTTPSKVSPVSSIGESISEAKVLTFPPARPARPLPIPPSHALTSTSTLKLSHQESQSTIGKSKPASAQSLQPPPRKARSPPSSFTPRVSDDNQWVSISLQPVAERSDNNERLSNPPLRPSNHKRAASADPALDAAPKFAKHSTRTTAVSKRTNSKTLPRLPPDSPPPPPQRPADASWKLEFRGVVKLVRWVSRRDKRANAENEDVNGVLEEKQPAQERRGYSIASLGRKSRDEFTQPRPIPGAASGAAPRPTSLARPRPKLDLGEEAKDVGKRRLTKSNPGLFGRNSSELKKRPSTEFAKRAGRRASSDAAQKALDAPARTSAEPGQKSAAERARRPSMDLGMAPNAGGVFVPNVTLAVAQPSAGLSDSTPSYSSPPLRAPTSSTIARALLTQTTITQTTATTITTVSTPFGITSSPFTGSGLPTSAVLTPVLEGPIYQSPPALDTTNEYPWVGIAVSGGLSPVGSNGISSAASMGGVSASPAVSSMLPSEATVHELVSPAMSVSPLPASSSVSSSVSPLMSTTSPLISNATSPFVSHTTSPLLFSDVHLAETTLAPIHVPVVDTLATSPSLSYPTARSNGNSVSAQVDAIRYAATDLGHGADPRFEVHYGTSTQLGRFSAAATDLGHGTSTRATSPTPSDRYAFSDDAHTHGILRTLTTTDHVDAPLPMPRRPFMTARDSSGSVTFDDSSAQSSPRIGGRRGMMTMSASDVGHGIQAFVPASRHQVQRSSSSLSIAGRIMRTLSIGSKGGQESDTESGRTTRKLTRRKMISSSRASSTVSLVYTNSGVPPVPPLPPGILMTGRYASEHGHESNLGHDGSTIGHGQGMGEWGASTSLLGHGSNGDPTSPAPTRLSFATTQSAPSGLGGGRNKLVKRRRDSQSRAFAAASGQTLASLNLGEVSRDPPRITTEFVQVPLMTDETPPLTGSVGGTTEDGHGHLMPPRPGLPRRTSSQRRWTIADMDDEEFLRQLEARLSGVGGLLRQSRMLDDFAMGVNQSGAELEDYRESETDDSVAEREWVRVRRAMMCVREIVRTEKSYLRHLIGFRDGEDASTMSSILADHLPRLIETSQLFCGLLEEDPSAMGVSKAFLDAEEQLEATLVQWSSVVGEVISSPQHRTESQATSEDGHTSSAGSASASSSWILRRRSGTGSSGGQATFPLNLTMTPVSVVTSKSKKSARGTKGKKVTEQDIVIAPTQRAIRYVLMYRELLLHTSPTSASRKHIEQALQCATRIARMCDEAQNHADHILSP